jgi:hypothetical protein
MPLAAINTLKEEKPVVPGQPLILALFTFADGTTKGYCSHDLTSITYGGIAYEPRVKGMGLVQRQALSADGIDSTPTITVPLADADKGVFKNYEYGANKGFLGATVTLTLVVWQVGTSNFSSDSDVIFQGICDLPEVTEDMVTVSATSTSNLTKQFLPNTPIQRTCPWQFPATKAERVIAAVTGKNGVNINLWRCGYSPDVLDSDVPGGTAAARGNYATGSTPFTACGYTRSDCVARLGKPSSNLIQIDTSNRATGNFGGITFVPEPITTSKGYVSSHTAQTLNDQNAAKYGGYFPLAYGTGWITPVVMHALGNQDVTSLECVLCVGQIDISRIQQVVVNGISIGLLYEATKDQQIAGYWTPVNDGGRHGTPNTDTFYNSYTGDSQPDPYGNLACIHIRIPDAIATTSQIPQVAVLFTGPKIRRYQNIVSASSPSGGAGTGVITITKTTLTNELVDIGDGGTITIENCGLAAANGTWVIAGISSTSFTLVGSSATGTGTGGDFFYYVSDSNLTWTIVDVMTQARQQYGRMDIPAAIASAAVDDVQIGYTSLSATSLSITAATNASPIILTVPAHGYSNGDQVQVTGVQGNLAANGVWVVAGVTTNTFQLTSSTGSGAYAGGGTVAIATFHSRYSATLMLTQQQTAASVVRGLRNSGRKLIIPNSAGLIRILSKQTLADQQPAPIAGSNSSAPLASINSSDQAANGYPAYVFDETSMLEGPGGKNPLTFPARAITDLPNELTCQFQDSENQYQVDAYTLIDTGAVTRWGQEVKQDAEAIGFNTFDQAKRALNTMQAEAFLGNEDALPDSPKGTRYIEFPTSIKGAHLQLGDIVVVSNTHYGIASQLFRLTKIQPTQDCETISLGATWHEDEWYTDLWGQIPDSLFTGQNRNKGIRPPFPWRANETAPPALDPWYDPTELFFGIAQSYTAAADRTALAHIAITGKLPLTTFSLTVRPPLVPLQATTATTGGTLRGGLNYWIKIAAKDTTGSTFGMSAPSFLISVVVPAGTNTNTITIGPTGLAWAPLTVGYVVFAGINPSNLSFQVMSDTTPASITLTSFNVSNYGEPDTEFDHVEVDIYKCEHAGVFGNPINNLTSTTFVITNAGWSTNEWAGYDCSITGFLNDPGEVAIANFTITSNTSDTLTLAASMPDPTSLSIEAGDVLIMRSLPVVTGRTLTDANWQNSLARETLLSITAATNASPIVLTVTAHGYANGDNVRVDSCLGNTAANGLWVVAGVTTNTFQLTGSTGNGAYLGGGTVSRINGLKAGAEVGRNVIIVAGLGRGQWKKIASNTTTSVTVDSDWLIQPDGTSRYIIVDSAPLTTQSSSSVPTAIPGAVTSIDIPVDNLANQSLAAVPYAVDAQGNRSFQYLSQVREIFEFGGAGAGAAFQGSVTLSVDGTLAIGSDLCPLVSLNAPATVLAVTVSVKNAPTGANITVALYVGGTLWLTLIILAGTTTVSASPSQIAGLTVIPAANNVRLDLTTVGTTSPGTDLTAQIFY